MTEYEYVEIAILLSQSHIQMAIFFVSIVFAYVVAAFATGEKLSKTAAISISCVYSLLLIGPFSGIFGIIDISVINLAMYLEEYPNGDRLYAQGSQLVTNFFALTPLVLGWFGSLVYMHIYVRKSVLEDRSRDT